MNDAIDNAQQAELKFPMMNGSKTEQSYYAVARRGRSVLGVKPLGINLEDKFIAFSLYVRAADYDKSGVTMDDGSQVGFGTFDKHSEFWNFTFEQENETRASGHLLYRIGGLEINKDDGTVTWPESFVDGTAIEKMYAALEDIVATGMVLLDIDALCKANTEQVHQIKDKVEKELKMQALAKLAHTTAMDEPMAVGEWRKNLHEQVFGKPKEEQESLSADTNDNVVSGPFGKGHGEDVNDSDVFAD